MYSRMALMVACWGYRILFDVNGCVSTLVNVDWTKWMYFCVNEFEVGVNDSIFSGNEQQKVYNGRCHPKVFGSPTVPSWPSLNDEMFFKFPILTTVKLACKPGVVVSAIKSDWPRMRSNPWKNRVFLLNIIYFVCTIQAGFFYPAVFYLSFRAVKMLKLEL